MKRKVTKIVIVLAILVVLVSIFYVVVTMAADRGRPYYENAGKIVWDIKTEEKIIALTFDDGPHKKYTNEVLDLLNKYDAKGTFFVVGEQVEKNPEVILRMYEEGHELANHTYSHPFKSTVPQLMEEIEQTNDAIFSITGYAPKLFRPVEGLYTDALIEEVVKDGYKVVMWSWHLDTEDWKDPGVKRIVDIVLKGSRKGNVVLFHDGGGNRKQTVEALAQILPALQKEGYKFVTISDLLQVQQKSKVQQENAGKS
ncbi:MAG: polysaccharide deacetylase family protein [Solibacillus sp.]